MFKTPQTITLTGTQLELSDTTGTETITGPKAGVTVSGGGLSRVFQVDAGVTASISGLTITGGKTAGNGGGLYNDGGTATLTNCTVSGNSASHRRRRRPVQPQRHGHADQLHRQRQLRRQRRRRPVQPQRHGHADQLHRQRQLRRDVGGGLYNGVDGTATLTNCTVSGNSAGFGGGGLFITARHGHADQLHRQRQLRRPPAAAACTSSYGTATLTNCTVSGNSAARQRRRRVQLRYGTATLTNCTVSGNSASYSGGGLYNYGGTATLTNCTVSGNSATGNGGGLFNMAGYYGGTATLTNCTVSGNSAAVSGGGLFNGNDSYGAATATLTNCTVSGNSAVDGGGISNQGTLIVSSCNIIKNQATSEGGGIGTTSGSVTITDSVINSNQVNSSGTALGGGIYSENSLLSLTNCTVNANQANGATALGGGIYALDSTVNVQSCTVNGNQANGTVLGEGGGIYSYGSVLTLVASTVKGNKATTGYADIFNGP